ncbi:class A beta-lactamase-related serine hydrolase [Saxibacter everestensis]|uniref:Class A beta-lactamase-related serine hydrolase n=1 Tax=Saxibacter everestensis TaxID=2909229 RepID=A0ABY8QSE4_9MICO|nr:class A beta-lactamase-related serine hydrolase [Brevibacteriaceae bacterium ZFBP1038]
MSTLKARWQELGAGGAFLARSLATGSEIGFNVNQMLPLASVAKVPLVLAVFDAASRGELELDRQLLVSREAATPGPTGTSAFQHPARIAIEDLAYLSLTISDNAAADTLFAEIGPPAVQEVINRCGIEDLRIRHSMRYLYDSVERDAAGDETMALALATRSESKGSKRQLLSGIDQRLANVGSVRSLVALLEAIWTDEASAPEACARLRRLMGLQLSTHRLATGFAADTFRLSGKTGTFLNLRHEIGVVETSQGEKFIIAALTSSSLPVFAQPALDAAIGTNARQAVEFLRRHDARPR